MLGLDDDPDSDRRDVFFEPVDDLLGQPFLDAPTDRVSNSGLVARLDLQLTDAALSSIPAKVAR